MAPIYVVEEIHASGTEISDVTDEIARVLDGCPRAHAIMGCIAMALVLQSPSLDGEQLPELIMDVSKFICTVLAGTDEPNPTQN